jgi:hypothetical protein
MTPGRPPAWAVLEQALRHKHPVHMRYRGNERLVCPHALGWKNGRAKALVYQTGGTTGEGELPADPRPLGSKAVPQTGQAVVAPSSRTAVMAPRGN